MRTTADRLLKMGLAVTLLATLIASSATPATAASSGVVLNEINCVGDDWIELANPTDTTIAVSGWLLTDDTLDRNPLREDHRYTLPAATSVPAHGVLAISQGDEDIVGFPFGISCGSDTIRLADASGALVDSVVVPVLPAGADTIGRLPSASGSWTGTTATPGAANAAPTPPDESQTSADSAWLFDPLSVVGISLAATPDALAELNAKPMEYVDATVTISRGSTAYGPYEIGLRLKGNSTFRALSAKASFKVDFAHVHGGQNFFGLRRLTLNSMILDPSMIAESVGYELSRSVEVPASRSGYSWVTLNGTTYGLYANVETLDERWAASAFASTMHIYEADADTDVTSPSLDIDAGPAADTSDLAALAVTATTAGQAWWQSMGTVADMTEMTRMWAVEHVISQWDGYSPKVLPSNYYLHSDGAGRFTMIPSSLDQTWKNGVLLGQFGEGVLFVRCVAVVECRTAYETGMSQIADWLQGHDLAARAKEVAAAIRPWMAADPRKVYSTADSEAAASAVSAAIGRRAAEIRAWLAAPSYTTAVESGGGGGGAGGEAGGGGTAAVNEKPNPGPAATHPAPTVGAASSPAAPPSTADPTVLLAPLGATGVARSRAVVPTTSVKRAPTVTGRAGTQLAVRVRGLTSGRHRTWLQIPPAWHTLGRTTVAPDGRGALRGISVSSAGTYLLRLDLPRGPRYVQLVVR